MVHFASKGFTLLEQSISPTRESSDLCQKTRPATEYMISTAVRKKKQTKTTHLWIFTCNTTKNKGLFIKYEELTLMMISVFPSTSSVCWNNWFWYCCKEKKPKHHTCYFTARVKYEGSKRVGCIEDPDTELVSIKPKTAVPWGPRGTSLLPQKRGPLSHYVVSDDKPCEAQHLFKLYSIQPSACS